MAAAIRYFVENMHGKAFLLPQCWGPSPIEDDRVPARRVKKLLANLGDAVILVEHPLPPERLKSVFGQMDIFLGTRMHSNIFSLSQNVPIIAIQYNHKTGGIAQMAGIEKWVVDINRLNDKVLVQKMELLWAEREQVRQHLSVAIPEMSRQACQPGVLLASDYATIAPRGQLMAERLRVAHLVYSLDIQAGGGITRTAVEMVKKLDPGRFEARLASLGYPGSTSGQEQIAALQGQGIQVFEAGGWDVARPYRSFYRSLLALRHEFARHPVDILHSHSEFSDISALGLKVLGNRSILSGAPSITPTCRSGRSRPLRRLLLTNLACPILFDAEVAVNPGQYAAPQPALGCSYAQASGQVYLQRYPIGPFY